MAEGCRCGRGALRVLGWVSAGDMVTSCVLLPFASALVLVLLSVTCWTPSDAFLQCPARGRRPARAPRGSLPAPTSLSCIAFCGVTVLVLGCSSVPFPAVKGVVFSFSFSRCRHRGGWGGAGPAPACPQSQPEGCPRGRAAPPPRRVRVSCESCTVTPAPAAPAAPPRPGRGGCWRVPAPAPASLPGPGLPAAAGHRGCWRLPRGGFRGGLSPRRGWPGGSGQGPGAAVLQSRSRRGARGRWGGRRYLLLSYCPGRAVIYCCTECPSAAAAAAVLYVTINRFQTAAPGASLGRGPPRRGGALLHPGRCRRREVALGRTRRLTEAALRCGRRQRKRGASGAMAAGGSLSRSERKAAARAEILQQEEQRDRRRQVRPGPAQPSSPRRPGPP